MAFYELIFKENLTPASSNDIMKSLEKLTAKIDVGQKHIKSGDRQKNIKITKGLIRDHFVANDTAVLSHGPGMIFDFENSIRRSRTETTRYEFKQGLLRLNSGREIDSNMLQTVLETISGIANVGPEADGFLYIGIADKPADAQRIQQLDGVSPIKFEHVEIVGIEREAQKLEIPLDKYMRLVEDTLTNSQLGEPLKTQVLTSMDLINYKGLAVVRIRVPRQSQLTFLGDECFLRLGSATRKATGPQIAAISRIFSKSV
jgi:Putative DNA-binding domain